MKTFNLAKKFARRILSFQHRRQLLHILYAATCRADLRKLAIAYGTDKEGSHFYAKHYQNHFQQFRSKEINLLEVGVGGEDDPKAGGHSLRMWRTYFPKGRIYGIDIFDKTFHDEARIKTFQGDQTDEVFLRDVAKKIGQIDLIIDDGSHINAHVIKTFETLFPLLSPGGIYAIEDLQTSYWENAFGTPWGGSSDLCASHTSMAMLKRLADGLNYEEFISEDFNPSYLDRNIISVHFYHNLCFVYKGPNEEGSNKVSPRGRPVRK